MSFEDIESAAEAAGEEMLSAFQKPGFTDMMEHDLMPKIRFVTDTPETPKAERSGPLEQTEFVFHVEPRGDAAEPRGGAAETPHAFQRESFGIDTSAFTHDADAPSGDYVGPTPDAISLRLENDVKDLTFAEEQLALAIERGTGVMQAMENVESARAVRDAHMKLYEEAIKFRAPSADTVPAPREAGEDGDAKLGVSVSHAKWELEKAYERGSKADIDKARRHMAEAKAEEEAKK